MSSLFLNHPTNDASLLIEPIKQRFLPFTLRSQMGSGSQGHTSWRTDGLKRQEGHCGRNESAYVCSFTRLLLPLFYSSSSGLLEPPSASAG